MTVRRPPGNLPILPTTFIGREYELDQIIKLLKDPQIRLVTLSGPGGVGKTRLALQAALQVSDFFENGVYFFDLSPLKDPHLVTNRVAQVFGIKESLSRSILQDIKDYLLEKNCVLIMDNFEHLLEAASIVSELIASTTSLKILVTSREILHLYGEYEYPVPPLAFPKARNGFSLDQISRYEAVNLFVQRARSSDPSFQLSGENASQVVEICMRLDGLPLAIELAAARTRIFSPKYLLSLLIDTLGTLTGGPHDVQIRHQTLRGAIDWSFNLLDKEEQRLFTSMSVFKGGCSLDAVEAVCGFDLKSGVIHELESLVNKNLVLPKEGPKAEPRFEFLETIYQYALNCFELSSERNSLRERHADYYLSLAEQAEPNLRGPAQEYWSNLIKVDYDNLLAALDWSFSQGDPQTGLRLVAALSEYWYYEGSLSESKKWMDVALNLVDEASPGVHARVLNGASMLAFIFGQHELGKRYNQTALEIARETGDRASQAWALMWLSAHSTKNPDEYLEGLKMCEQAVFLFEEIGDLAGLAWSHNQIGEITRMIGDFERAGKAYEAALRVCRQIGHSRREAIALVNLSYVAQHQGKYKNAEEIVIQGLRLLHSLDLRYHCAIALSMLVGPVAAQGKVWRAAKLLGASHAIFERMAVNLQPADQLEIDRYIKIVEDSMHNKAFQAAWTEGMQLNFEQAMEYACQKDADESRSAGKLIEAPSIVSLAESLSEREQEVLHLLATSLSIDEIATKLFITPSTLRTHTKNIYRKLDVHRRVEAVERGRELGFL